MTIKKTNIGHSKLICAIYVSIWLLWGVNPSAAVEYIDRIVAVVNDDIITLSDLNQLLEPYIAQIRTRGYPPEQERRMMFKVREDVLNQLIDEKLTSQEIKKDNIQVSEGEIDAVIERIKESQFLTDEELREQLAKDGLTYEGLRKRMKEQLLRNKLVNLEIKSKIVLTQEDIQTYYDDHPELYGGEVEYHLRNIIMTVSFVAGEASVREKMNAILEKLKTGEAFETLARQYSESPTAMNGGELGLFKMSSLSPQIQDAIRGLKAGEYTSVLDTDQGYQIFYVDEIKRSPGKPLDQVANEIRDKLYHEIVNRKFESWLKDLRKTSHIKIIK
jgi:peptidyl-prolyl cis-trans isomerase SurA